MGDWLDDLKRAEQDRDRTESEDRKWRLHCAQLIDAKGPDLWRELAERVASDVKRVAQVFPNKDSMRLEFEDNGDDFTLTNPSQRRNYKAAWRADKRVIDLELRLNFPEERVTREEITFHVTDKDEVQMRFAGTAMPESISEKLIRKLLP